MLQPAFNELTKALNVVCQALKSSVSESLLAQRSGLRKSFNVAIVVYDNYSTSVTH